MIHTSMTIDNPQKNTPQEGLTRYFRMDVGSLTVNNLGQVEAILNSSTTPQEEEGPVKCTITPPLPTFVATPSFLCYFNDVPCGVLLGVKSERDARLVIVQDVRVLPAYQNIGVGRYMIDSIVAAGIDTTAGTCWVGAKASQSELVEFMTHCLNKSPQPSEKENGLMVWEFVVSRSEG